MSPGQLVAAVELRGAYSASCWIMRRVDDDEARPSCGATPAHHHRSSAFVLGYVLSGEIRSQVDGGQIRVYRAGESWKENPGALHGISENASATEPARLLAIFVTDTGDTELTTSERR
jgi:hypothetical protein